MGKGVMSSKKIYWNIGGERKSHLPQCTSVFLIRKEKIYCIRTCRQSRINFSKQLNLTGMMCWFVWNACLHGIRLQIFAVMKKGGKIGKTVGKNFG